MATSDKHELLDMFSDEYNPMVQLGHRIGPEALDAVLEVLGGQKPHIPQRATFWRGLERTARDEQIRACFRGNNHAELAAGFGLCERQIRQIVGRSSREYKRAPDPTRAVHVPDAVYSAVEELAAKHGTSARAITAAVLEEALKLPTVKRALRARFGEQVQLQVVNG